MLQRETFVKPLAPDHRIDNGTIGSEGGAFGSLSWLL